MQRALNLSCSSECWRANHQTMMANIILVNSTVWGKQLHGGVEKLCSKQERTILVVCSFFWQVFEASFTYLPLLSLLIVTEWRLWTCTSVLVTMMRAEWKLCNTSHFEYTEVTNVGGCPKVKKNITKFTVCDSSDERKKIQLAQVRNKVLPVQDQYRAFVPVYILKN